MPLRTFVAQDGSKWTAWRVESGSAGAVAGTPREWLAFKNEAGTEVRRLFEIPPRWDRLSDERLDLLCRTAEVAKIGGRYSPPEGIPRPT